MDDLTLDVLLREADSDAPLTPRATELLTQVADREAERFEHRNGARRGAIIAGCIVGALSLGIGTAVVAGPGVAHWWLWIPDDDLTYVTQPFELNGDMTICTLQLRVQTSGQPDDDAQTVQRLYDARQWLSQVNWADYEDEARDLMVEIAGEPIPVETSDPRLTVGDRPYELAHAHALMAAVSQEMLDRGLVGDGVTSGGTARCAAVDGE